MRNAGTGPQTKASQPIQPNPSNTLKQPLRSLRSLRLMNQANSDRFKPIQGSFAYLCILNHVKSRINGVKYTASTGNDCRNFILKCNKHSPLQFASVVA